MSKDQPVTITFDKASKRMVYNLLRSQVTNLNCPFCDVPIRVKNFAGAIFYDGEARFIDGSFRCLMDYSNYQHEEQES